MPSHKPEENKDHKTDKPISDGQRSVSHSESPHPNQETSRGHHSATKEPRSNKPRVIEIGKMPQIDVKEGDETNRISREANKISRWSTGVNFILMLCTVILAGYAIIQANSARDAAKIAQKTLDTTRKYDSITLANQKIADRKADSTDNIKNIRENDVFNAQKQFYTNTKKGIDAQIGAFKESRKDFEIENRPYLQVYNISIDSTDKKDWNLIFLLLNSGKL